MKFLYRILIASALVTPCFVCTSCEWFLEEDVESSIPQNTYFRTEEEAVKFLYGAYASVRSTVFGPDFFLVTDCMTDDMEYRVSTNYTYKAISALQHNKQLNTFYTVWNKLYKVVNDCNILIDRTNLLRSDEKVTYNSGNLIEAEARFIRAWAYLNLVQLWGDVPLQTLPTYNIKEDNLVPERAPAASVYAQIFSDLNFAYENLTDKPGSVIIRTDITYPLTIGKGAVRVLLARAYLIHKQYSDVVEYLQPMIDNSGDGADGAGKLYGLMASHEDVFDQRKVTENIEERKREILWTMEASKDNAIYNSWHAQIATNQKRNYNGTSYTDEELPCPTTSATGAFAPTEDLILTYDAQKDKRYQWQYKMYSQAPYSYFLPMKGYDMGATVNNQAGCNQILIRFADALLMYAEAKNELDDPSPAVEALNRVRVRAGLDPVDLADLSDVKSELRDLIMMERRHEFAHECYRIFDLRRTGTYISEMERFNRKFSELKDKGVFKVFVPQYAYRGDNTSVYVWGSSNKYPQSYHVLHPIPYLETVANKNLTQNPGY